MKAEKNEFALRGWAVRWQKDGILYVVNRCPNRDRNGDWILKDSLRPIGFGKDEVFPEITCESDAVEVELVVRLKQ